MIKTLTLKITEEEHKKIKILSAEEGKSIKDFIMDLIKIYNQKKKEEFEFEPLDEQDRKDLEDGKDDIANGDYEPMDKVFKELRQG